MRMDKVIQRVISLLPPLPANSEYGFVPLQWTVFAGINSTFNKNSSINAGYEVDDWKITRSDRSTFPVVTPVKILSGMDIGVSVRDSDGFISKVGYEMNVYGYFVIVGQPPID